MFGKAARINQNSYSPDATTLNIYTDVTKELKRSGFEGFDSYFKTEFNSVSGM